jgi:ubiquitin C-terminal hydrolase
LVDSFDYLESFIQYLSIIINNYTTVILYFITGDDTIKNFINYFNNLIDSLASYMQLLKEPITDYYSNNNISNSGNLLEVNSILICLTNIKNLNNTYTDSNLNILLEKCINISNSTIDLINNLITPLKTVLSNSSSNNTKQIVKTYFLGFYGVLKNLSNIYDNYGFQLINSVFKSQFSNLTC